MNTRLQRSVPIQTKKVQLLPNFKTKQKFAKITRCCQIFPDLPPPRLDPAVVARVKLAAAPLLPLLELQGGGADREARVPGGFPGVLDRAAEPKRLPKKCLSFFFR